MLSIYEWLRQHRLLNGGIATVCFLLAVLPHEEFGKWIHRTFFRGDLDRYNALFLAICGGLMLLPATWLIRQLWQERWPGRKVCYLLATIGLMVLSYHTIMILATEAIHFLQYAGLAFLLFPLIRHYGETLGWATLLGALDEAYQYFYLAPQRTGYYDFNDIILNLLGAAMGLIFVWVMLPASGGGPIVRSRRFSPTLLITGSIFLLVLGLRVSGLLFIYPPAGEEQPLLLLVREPPEGFWSRFHHYHFHAIRPWEGLLLLVALFAFYRPLGQDG